MVKRCLVCECEGSIGSGLRSDGICASTEVCKLRFAALCIRVANAGTDTAESTKLAKHAQLLEAMTPLAATGTTWASVGAFRVAKMAR